jgi:hypothetical protein
MCIAAAAMHNCAGLKISKLAAAADHLHGAKVRLQQLKQNCTAIASSSCQLHADALLPSGCDQQRSAPLLAILSRGWPCIACIADTIHQWSTYRGPRIALASILSVARRYSRKGFAAAGCCLHGKRYTRADTELNRRYQLTICDILHLSA